MSRASRPSRLLALACLLAAPLAAQGPRGFVVLGEGHVFRPLRADPKQPGFFAAYLWVNYLQRNTSVANVGLGEDIGLLRDTAAGRPARWEVSLSAGVFSQFDMRTPSYDLLNTDFVIGVPVAWRPHGGPLALRVRVYHQSSHLGDEYLLHSGVTRVNFSYEAVELLASRDFGTLRFYGGGERLLRRDPPDFHPLVLHGGVELGAPRRAVLGGGTPFFALDAKSSEERHWRVGWDVRCGVEFAATGAPPRDRRWSLAVRGFRGPSPYGQFYGTDLSAIGLSLGFSL